MDVARFEPYDVGVRRVALSAVVVIVLVAGCTSSEGETTTSTEAPVTTSPVTTSPVTTSPMEETTTTTAPSTTTTTAAPETTTTSVAETTTTTVDVFYGTPAAFGLAPPAPLDGSDGASGSGCSPGNPMRDGLWFGFVHDIYPAGVEIDIACFWFGEIAYEVGESFGEEVNNDYYIQNENPLMRKVPIGDDPIVWTLAGDTTEGHSPIAFDEWPLGGFTYVPCPGDFCGVWLYLNDGLITEIVEQYVP